MGFYFGIGGSPVKAKSAYLGVSGVAHKIKKIYVGVNGSARLFFGGIGKSLSYHGVTDAKLVKGRKLHASANTGDYIIFGGGVISNSENTYTGLLDIYDKSLSKVSNTLVLSPGRQDLSAASVGDYAVFCGGWNGNNAGNGIISEQYASNAYDSGLSVVESPELDEPRHSLASASNGTYALFAGGINGGTYSKKVEAYTDTLTKSDADDLTSGAMYLFGGSAGGHMFFGGGRNSNGSVSTVDAYDGSLTKTSIEAMSYAREGASCACAGNCAIIGGGTSFGTSAMPPDTEAYDSYLTKISVHRLSCGRSALDAASIGGCAVFGTGYGDGSSEVGIDMYDPSMTHIYMPYDGIHRAYYSAGTVGSYVLFGGGVAADGTASILDSVDAYILET